MDLLIVGVLMIIMCGAVALSAREVKGKILKGIIYVVGLVVIITSVVLLMGAIARGPARPVSPAPVHSLQHGRQDAQAP